MADTSEEYNEGDEVGEQRHVVEEVVKNLGLNTQLYMMFTISVNITIATSYHLSMSVC